MAVAATVFVSYSSADASLASSIYTYLNQHGIRTLKAPEDIGPGQDWASGSVFGLVEAITGIAISRDVDSGRVQVLFRQPILPKGINLLEINGLRLGEEEIDLQLHRTEHDTGVLVRRRSAGIDVMVSK